MTDVAIFWWAVGYVMLVCLGGTLGAWIFLGGARALDHQEEGQRATLNAVMKLKAKR